MLGVYIRIKSLFGPLISPLLGRRYRLPARLLELKIASSLGNPTNERIIEYPWVLKHLEGSSAKKILDVGCGPQGMLTNHLLSKGYNAYAIDINECTKLPSERFFLRDARKTGFADSSFDTIVLLSTLEHIGTDGGQDDLGTMKELFRILKKGGLMLFTTPFAEQYAYRGQRFSNMERLSYVTEPFQRLEEHYFVQRGNKWVEVSLAEAETSTRGYEGVHSVAITAMVLKKS